MVPTKGEVRLEQAWGWMWWKNQEFSLGYAIRDSVRDDEDTIIVRIK